MNENKNDNLVNDTKDSVDKTVSENIEQETQTEEINLAEDEKSKSISENEEKENLDSIKKELEDNKDKLLRALAENENTRKQMEKIRIETNKYGVQPLAREILNVVDNFNRALNLKDDNNEKSLEEGFTLIQKEILSILDKFNVKKINIRIKNRRDKSRFGSGIKAEIYILRSIVIFLTYNILK